MTIKELCSKYKHCKECPFNNACPYYEVDVAPFNFTIDMDKSVTKAIIETAKILSEEGDYNG